MKIARILAALLIITAFAVSVCYYPDAPDELVSHWDAEGRASGKLSKEVALFILPLIMIGLFALFVNLPKIDPLKRNFRAFQDYYDAFMVLMLSFLASLHLMTVSWNLGYQIDLPVFLSVWFFVLFYYIGVLLPHTKKNWFVGIRTPWTMSSESVWKKTHERAAILFKLSGVIALLGAMVPGYFIIFVVFPVLSSALYVSYFSYKEYQRERS